MAASDSESSSSVRKRSGRQKNPRRLVVGAVILGVLALIGYGGWTSLKRIRQNRSVARAGEFLKAQDYLQAGMSATYALQQNPKDVEASRIMAEVCAALGQKQEVAWRKRVLELKPDDLNGRMALARAGLNHANIEATEEAIAGATEEQKKSAAYHEIAARLAGLRGRGKELEASVMESVRLDPTNETSQLTLAAVRLGSEKVEIRRLAREEIEHLAENPKLSRPALLVLIRDAVIRDDPQRALDFAGRLNKLPGVTFDDRIRYLRLLRQGNRRESWWLLAQMQHEALDGNQEAAALMTYMSKSGMSKMAAEWGKTLPEKMRKNSLVGVALTEAALMQQDWEGVKSQVKFGEWKDLDFQRLALLARVAREEGDLPGANTQWRAAMAAANGRPEDLATLARLATTWKWNDEANAVLWQIARGSASQMPALQSLSRNFQMDGNTRELLNVANRMLELDQENALVKNNVAYLSLLLEVDRERAHALAREVYSTDAMNPSFVSTYALALHLLGKSEEGLRLMQALPPKALEVPQIAFSYGVLLAALNKGPEATRHLDQAATSSILFPQEKALMEKARSWIARK